MATELSDRVEFSTLGSQLVAKLMDARIVSGRVASQIRERLTAALDRQGSAVRSVRIDLACVEMIGSAGLNELIGFRTRARGQGMTVELTDAQPQVREVLIMTRLDRVFDVPDVFHEEDQTS